MSKYCKHPTASWIQGSESVNVVKQHTRTYSGIVYSKKTTKTCLCIYKAYTHTSVAEQESYLTALV